MEFSVVIPTYNREKIIGRCLDAILAQEKKPAEIVVVDDGSADSTKELITKNYKEVKYIKIENSGPLAARKVGIENTSSEWIALCDSDDVWHPDHLRRRCSLIEKFPNSTFTFSNFSLKDGNNITEKFDEAGSDFFKSHSEKTDGDFVLFGDAYLALLETQISFPSTIAFHRSVYEECGGLDTRFSRMASEDAHFTRRCALYGVTSCDRSSTVTIYRTPNSVSSNDLRNLEGRIAILQDILEKDKLAEKQKTATTERIKGDSARAFRGNFRLWLQGMRSGEDEKKVIRFWKDSDAVNLNMKDYMKFSLFLLLKPVLRSASRGS